MMTEWAHSRTGIDIHPARRLAPTFSSITAPRRVGETCRIGNRVKLYHGVTLAPVALPRTKREYRQGINAILRCGTT